MSFLLIIAVSSISIGKPLFITDKHNISKKEHELKQKDENLNKYFSKKELGVITSSGKTIFRLFTPNAVNVSLVIFNKAEDNSGNEYAMTKDNNGVWETEFKKELYGKFYNFKVSHLGQEPVLCLDPYAKAVASYNTYFTPRKGIIINNDYNWDGDEWIKKDWRDLIIYEMHIKDMTAHPSSGAKNPGTYKALTEKGIKGGIDYLKKLGVNTVELLPSQEFANIEIPYKDTLRGKYNTWNPYERNHWGYMTAAFFAPEELYSQPNAKVELNTWSGTSGKQVNEFKDMVKAFHKNGIAVIMDVVYNHLSEYEFGNLKEIDKDYYFRLDAQGNFIAESYCGNDIKTERPMMRRMIIESILYWMKEYHIDGFRFDLGKLIDWETIEEIIREARKINPAVVIVCEPWGGGYDPAGFSLRGWGSWNDQIRNGIKGENPNDGLGWIFAHWYGNNNPDRIKSYVNGTLTKDTLGLFQKKEHSVNYLESHDGYTFGDFIRIGTRERGAHEFINDIDQNAKLSPLQLKLNKLGALFLLTSQGITMISEGQEYARSKVIPKNIQVDDTLRGTIDHNTYNKDNEVNYINYQHADMNEDLFNYYQGLIELRTKHEAFRRADYKDVKFIDFKNNSFALGYNLKYKNEEFIVLFNADMHKTESYKLPSGKWHVLVNENTAGTETIKNLRGEIKINPSSGVVLIKK
ncbi:MAG TPA: alpha-amylase family glycosyl hydrolase [Ignavibacteriaceae bacterium]|nr:alpha-amylase family glycosyl hydrolase [Ignavibacteriaceae bacterium]